MALPASIKNEELVFTGTDISVSMLFVYLKAGGDIETFLEDYPKVHLQQVLDLLELAEQQLNSVC